MDKKFIFKNISYLDSTSMTLKRGDIRVTDGWISEVSTLLEPGGNEKVFLSENIIGLPGLVNAHLHPSKEIYGSILDSSPVGVVLDTVHKNNALEDSEGQYIGSLKSLMRALKKGVTSFGLFTSRIESDVRAARQIGCRCVISFCQSNTWVGRGKKPQKKSVKAIIQAYLCAEKKYQNELITLSPATASELSADDILLTKLHDLARTHQTKFILHAHEGLYQVESHKNVYGMSGIKRLANLNILDEDTTIIHSCYLSDTDLKLLRTKGCGLIHCPVSNSFVGAGTLPLRSLLPDVTVGLGTDAAMVNPGNDITFDALFALYHHGDADFNKKVDASTILYMMTEGGAKTLGIQKVGRIETGFKADFIFFDTHDIDVDYINTPVSLMKMLNHENPHQVMVNGKIVLSEGKFINDFLQTNDSKFSTIRGKVIV